ncbi:MAG: deoxyribodipyrimidine photolyase [Gemmatimonadetes bacterium]|nr:deoxyribodipyrimidine photolyase [Gemmatimonadota bacterium]NIO30219.1 deoxyribodipyrimidine photolyase [Gemmatimonadota bacterium]
MDSRIPQLRIEACNEAPLHADGEYVLHWMNGFRRVGFNFSLQRAVELARALKKPLVILEALRCDYPWASERLHRFVLDGMAANARRLNKRAVNYYAYIEDRRGKGRGLLNALASRACAVVTDDYPAFFLPRMVATAATQVPVTLEKVDSNGLLPLRAAERVFETAYSFRRFVQKNLLKHLSEMPSPNPLKGVRLPRLEALPADIVARWPNSAAALLKGPQPSLQQLPVDHAVPVTDLAGGESAASAVLERFLNQRLSGYAEDRNHPDENATSGLSPYLHFGHISSHQVFSELMASEDWDTDRLAGEASGKRSGWWGVSESGEALLDQLITWRELGFNMSSRREDYDRYESLPAWAQKTLAEHAGDKRPYLYTLEDLEDAATHDDIWNAAQTELVRDGRLHNYMRMLWGKKILEWSPTPQDALQAMIELNNKYALDGRDPNSYSGIFWCLGRYDRPWGPERPIFGKIRYMSSENTARKLRLSAYLERYASP